MLYHSVKRVRERVYCSHPLVAVAPPRGNRLRWPTGVQGDGDLRRKNYSREPFIQTNPDFVGFSTEFTFNILQIGLVLDTMTIFLVLFNIRLTFFKFQAKIHPQILTETFLYLIS